MTDAKAINTLNSLKQYYNDKNEDSYVGFDDEDNEAIDMAIKSLRYKPIILHEHDAEPRRLRAILDTATDEIYICKLTRQGAEILGMTIEDRGE
jgi:hypothetical protein